MQQPGDGANHAKRIELAVSGKFDGMEIDSAVRTSWSRCLGSYLLDPLQVKKPQVVERRELESRREALGAVMQIARIEMLNLARQMQNSECGIMLTDADGVILCYVGDPAFTTVARRSGFREGAVWSERELGTNGMGTCLMTQRPIKIDRVDHFLLQNTQLTCSAAPIFDGRGNAIAALDISGCSSAAQSHTLVLVDLAAQNIENRALLAVCRQYHVMRFHPHAEFVSTIGEGVIAFDESGAIAGVNRSALSLLGHRDHDALIGRNVDTVFDIGVCGLQHWSSNGVFRPEVIVTRSGHLQVFATVQSPVRHPARTAASRTTATDAHGAPTDALDALRSGDAGVDANIQIARRVLDRDISVLLLGETGSGKGHFAKALHASSRRADKPFVSVNCAAIPELLIESELFGYRPGAFTGAARQGHCGRILQANGGTLFLDEIGDMPLSLQARLLTVIEDREVLPLGASKPVPVDIRIVSATHRVPGDMIADGLFREDLYYRLNGVTLTMPALRDRSDVAAVIRRIVQMEAGPERRVQVDDRLIQRLLTLDWPGNIRQLRNTLRTMLALSEGDALDLEDLDQTAMLGLGPHARSHDTATAPPPVTVTAADVGREQEDILASAECDALKRTLEACRWNVSVAAVRLHVSRKTMYRMMHRHGLVRRSAGDPTMHESDLTRGVPG